MPQNIINIHTQYKEEKQSETSLCRHRLVSPTHSLVLWVGDSAQQSVQQCPQQDANQISPGNWLSLHESQMTFRRRLTGLVDSISSGTPTCFSRRLGLLSNPFSPVSAFAAYPHLGHPTVVSASLSPLTRCTLGSLWHTKRLTGIQEHQNRKRGWKCKPQSSWMVSRSAYLTSADIFTALSVFVSISHLQINHMAWLALLLWQTHRFYWFTIINHQ